MERNKCIICGKPVRRNAKYCCEYHRNKDYKRKKKEKLKEKSKSQEVKNMETEKITKKEIEAR